jgi:hypothetical protein
MLTWASFTFCGELVSICSSHCGKVTTHIPALLQRCADFDVEIFAQLLERGEAAVFGGVCCFEVEDDVDNSGFVRCFGGGFSCALALRHLAREDGG